MRKFIRPIIISVISFAGVAATLLLGFQFLAGLVNIPADAGSLKGALITFLVWTTEAPAYLTALLAMALLASAAAMIFWHPEEGFRYWLKPRSIAIPSSEVWGTFRQLNDEISALKKQLAEAEKVTKAFPHYQEQTANTFGKAFEQIGVLRSETFQHDLALKTAAASVEEIRLQQTRGFEHLRRAGVAIQDREVVDRLFVQIVQVGEELLSPERAMGALGIATAEWERDFTLLWENLYGEIIRRMLPYPPMFKDDFHAGRLAGEIRPEDQVLLAQDPSKERFIRDIRGVAAKVADWEGRADYITASALGPLTDQGFYSYEPRILGTN